MQDLHDKNGIKIQEDDVIYNGLDYYRIYTTDLNETEMLSCTNGYLHDIKQEYLKDFERIGTYLGNESLFECD
jgi:hypothetical protein